MKKFGSRATFFLATLCAVAFVLTTAAAVLLVNVDLGLFNAGTYENALVQQQVYTRMPRILAKQVVTLMDNPQWRVAFFQSLNASDMETLISGLLPPDELRALTENFLDQVFAYLNGDQATISISLASLKQGIASPAGTQAVFQLIRSQPDCNYQVLLTLLAELRSGNVTLVLCRPPEEVLTLLSPLIQDMLITASAQIPDSQVLYPPAGTQPNRAGPLGGGPSGWIRLARLVMLLSPCLPLLMLIFITLLAVRTLKGWLGWWGIPIFFSGLLSLGLALSATAFFEQAWLLLLANRIPAYLSPALVSLSHDVAYAILQKLTTGITDSGIVLAVLGLVMWVGSGFIKNKPDISSATSHPAA